VIAECAVVREGVEGGETGKGARAEVDPVEETVDQVDAVPEGREIEGAGTASRGDNVGEETGVRGGIGGGDSVVKGELGAEDIAVVSGFFFPAETGIPSWVVSLLPAS
jgi:hypothetical protein